MKNVRNLADQLQTFCAAQKIPIKRCKALQLASQMAGFRNLAEAQARTRTPGSPKSATPTPRIVSEHPEDSDCEDFIGQTPVWIAFGKIALRICQSDERLEVTGYHNGHEAEDEIGHLDLDPREASEKSPEDKAANNAEVAYAAFWDESTLDQRESFGLDDVLSSPTRAEEWWGSLTEDDQKAVRQKLGRTPEFLEALREILREKRTVFAANGGRGVELADEIDAIEAFLNEGKS